MNSEKTKNSLTTYNQNFIFYKKYHSNIANILVHIFCIPSLVWSIFGIANTLGSYAGLDQQSYLKYIPSNVIYSAYMIYYYIIAPKKVFWQTFYLYLIILINLNSHYNTSTGISTYLIVHILGWVFQIASHKYLEGNSPALLDGIVQSFLTAPIFIVHEVVENIQGFSLKYTLLLYSLYKLFF